MEQQRAGLCSTAQSQAGFSGIEFLIAVLLISITAMIALPNSDTYLSRFSVHTAAREVASDLQLARMKAISKNTRFRVTFDTNNETYQVEEEVLGVWQSAGAVRNAPSGIDLVSAGNPVFESAGGAPGGATVTLQNSEGEVTTVTVLAGGRVKID